MNRRNFINSILVAGAAFTILPGAGRIWHAQRAPILTQADINVCYDAFTDLNQSNVRSADALDRMRQFGDSDVLKQMANRFRKLRGPVPQEPTLIKPDRHWVEFVKITC